MYLYVLHHKKVDSLTIRMSTIDILLQLKVLPFDQQNIYIAGNLRGVYGIVIFFFYYSSFGHVPSLLEFSFPINLSKKVSDFLIDSVFCYFSSTF